jgi:hypothetical protein
MSDVAGDGFDAIVAVVEITGGRQKFVQKLSYV